MENYNVLKQPAVEETSRTDLQYGGAQAYWLAEGETVTASIPKFRMVELHLKKLVVLDYLSDELMDAALENYSMNTLGMAASRKLSSAIVAGSGAGEFLGILNSGACITADAEGGQAAGSFVIENAATMVGHLTEESHHSMTCWLVQPTLYQTMITQQFAAGDVSSPLIKWRSGGEKYNKLCGFDLIPYEACSEAGSRGDIILADLSQYLIAEKTIRKNISGYVRFLNDESVLHLVIQADGAPAWSNPVTPENSSTLVSQFVTLAARS
jgi:HK97 family phage major capsid protein